MKTRIFLRMAATVLMLGMLSSVWAQDGFQVSDIRVEGLRRISAGTVFNYLPVRTGDLLDSTLISKAVRDLYNTGFFHEIDLYEESGVLVVRVVERPAIASILVEGNKVLKSDPLMEGLRAIGLSEGLVFNRSMLDRISQEVLRQYYSLGYYAVEVESTVTPLERNRVDLRLEIREGKQARIKQVALIGNTKFSEKKLLKLFQTGTKNKLAFFSSRDKYAREKLMADLETLRSFYLDRGFLAFSIESTQVSLSPDKESVYITVNVTEGEQFTIRKHKVLGKTLLAADELEKLVSLKEGQTYSQRSVEEAVKRIRDNLSDEGFAFARIEAYPELDEESMEADLTFVIDPGHRVFVRRISFRGNNRTQDKVLRREMRQMEGSWYSLKLVEKSKIRLQRLGFFDGVDIKTEPVEGQPDQVDLIVSMTETSSGAIQLSAGYSEDQGFSIGGSLEQDNFLGTGNRFGFGANTSKSNTYYNFDFFNPYFTKEGISRGYSLFFREMDTTELNLSNVSTYATDSYGGRIEFGFPIKEDEKLFFGIGYDYLKLKALTGTPQRILDFIADNGTEFNSFRANMGWSGDTRDQFYFATQGVRQSINLDITVPGSDLTYYKINYRYQRYHPLMEKLVLTWIGNVSYGEGYGDNKSLPFFENYYGGGANSVRGFEMNSLGPRDPLDPKTAIGGNIRLLGTAELVLPFPIGESKGMRMGLFVDGGNVYNGGLGDVSLQDIRYSSGVAFYWLSPVGAIKINVATALNKQTGDDTKLFQFSLGVPL